MKIIYLNVLKGCEEPDRYEKLIRFLRAEKPDVFGLSELYGWDGNGFEKLQSFKKSVGYEFDVFGFSENNRHVALFSKRPWQDARVYNKGFHCAAVSATTEVAGKKIVFILTHLSPRSEDARLAELGEIAKDFMPEKTQVLMGDMNSLSASDEYDSGRLLAEMKKLGLEKFGKDKIRTNVTAFLEKQGFVDAVRQTSSDFEYSVPTLYNKDSGHFSQLRLDYVYVSGDLSAHLETAYILRNQATNEISDHFPVIVETVLD